MGCCIQEDMPPSHTLEDLRLSGKSGTGLEDIYLWFWFKSTELKFYKLKSSETEIWYILKSYIQIQSEKKKLSHLHGART